MIKDSGKRKEFKSGAVRDVAEGKGRFDLMPIDVMAEGFADKPDLKKGLVCLHFGVREPVYLTQIKYFDSALVHVAKYLFNSFPIASLEVAIHMEEGAKKYGLNNWRKGIPLHSFVDSALRHLMKHEAGYADERHDRACVWNLFALAWTVRHHPEMNDLDVEGYSGGKTATEPEG